MDKISDTAAIAGIVIGAKNQESSLTDGHFGDNGYQILERWRDFLICPLGWAPAGLKYLSKAGLHLTFEGHLQWLLLPICLVPAIHRSCRLLGCLRDRRMTNVAIYRATGAKYKALVPVLWACWRVLIRLNKLFYEVLLKWVCHRISYRFEGSKMDDPSGFSVSKKCFCSLIITQIIWIKPTFCLVNLFDGFEHILVWIDTIVDTNHFHALFQQIYNCVAADVSGSSCYKNFHKKVIFDAMILYLALLKTDIP